jgi:hypothetical protein
MNTKQFRKMFGHVILTVELDRREMFPEDPGQGTPAMVILQSVSGKRVIDCGTLNCALGSSELSDKGTVLTPEQLEWLQSLETEVEAFLSGKETE